MLQSKAADSQVAVRRGAMENEAIEPYPPSRFFSLSPFALMREFSDEMDRTFGARGLGITANSWAPAIDVQQCNGTLTVTAELPGLRKDDVRVEVTDDNLIIEGERKLEHKSDHDGIHRRERTYGRFYRAIPLPEGIRTDQLKAELQDGILKVTAPAPEIRKNPRLIPVEQGKPSQAPT